MRSEIVGYMPEALFEISITLGGGRGVVEGTLSDIIE
jgi:hypothetical protein